MKTVSLCNDECVGGKAAGRLSIYGRNSNIVIFSNAISMTDVKLCVMVVLVELYLLIPLSVTLIISSYGSVKRL